MQAIFLGNVLRDYEVLVLNPGFFQFANLSKLIKTNYDEFMLFLLF